jgi:hypothetical protein
MNEVCVETRCVAVDTQTSPAEHQSHGGLLRKWTSPTAAASVMEDSIVYALCVFAFFIAVGIFSRWLEQRSDATAEFEEPPFVALRSPSRTNAFDRRIEAALRCVCTCFTHYVLWRLYI